MPKIINTKENKITLPLKRKIVPEDIEINFEIEIYNGEVADEVSLISFTIDSTTYQAEDGMTWEEWVESDYNIDGYTIGSAFNSINSTTGKYVAYSGSHELYTATIVSGRDYTLVTSISGGAG